MDAPRLVLLDTATLYFRAFHALPSTITAPDGTPSGAVRGFLDMVAVLVERLRPAQLVACWDDDWRPAWRVARLPSYKAHRVAAGSADGADGADGAPGAEDAPPELLPQVEGVAALLAALGVPRVGAPACEADDVIGVLATRAAGSGSGSGTGVDVVSGDRDLLQLVDDAAGGGAGRRVVWIGRGVREAEVVDGAALAARYALPAPPDGHPGDAYADLAVLRGDPSDGLPGVAGIGEKTAAALLRRHGDLLGVLEAAAAGGDGVSPAQRRRLAEAADYLDVAPRVVRVLRDGEVVPPHGQDPHGADAADVPPLPAPPASLRGAVDDAALDALAERWGARSPAERLLAALDTASPG